MLLNTQIFTEVVSAAKTATANSPRWQRAIDRAVTEILRARYWSFADGVLTIQSTTSKKLYRISTGNHTCEAKGSVCKHRAARKLMANYFERLA